MSSFTNSPLTVPDRLTISTVKSKLVRMGVELPPTDQQKDYYDLYLKAIQNTQKRNLLENRAESASKSYQRASNNSNEYEDKYGRYKERRVSGKENLSFNANMGEGNKDHKREKILKFNNNRLFKEKNSQKEKVPTPFKSLTEKDGLIENVLAKRFPLVEKKNQEILNERVNSHFDAQRGSPIGRRSTMDPKILSQSFITSSFGGIDDQTTVNARQTPYFRYSEVSAHREIMMNNKTSEFENLQAIDRNIDRKPRIVVKEKPKDKGLSLLTLVLGILVIVLGIGAAVAYKSYNPPLSYCENGMSILVDGSECQPCPKDADCSNGIMECRSGFQLDDGRCQENKDKYLAKEKYIKHISKILSSHLGQHICDGSTGYTFFFYQLEQKLRSYYGREAFYEETISLVRSELTRATEANSRNVETDGIVFDSETNQFYAKTASFSLQCRATMFLSAHIFSIVLVALVGYMGFTLLAKHQASKRSQQLAQKIYSEIVIELNKVRAACVKELYIRAINKYGETCIREIWPLVEGLRIKYKRILVFKDEYKGAYELFWKI